MWKSVLIVIGVVVAWYVLQAFLLPKMGVKT